MKRITLIALTMVYLISCVGFGISSYYCCGKLASVTLTYGEADNTGNQTPKKDNCCKKEKQSLKVKDTHINSAAFSAKYPSPVTLPVFIHGDRLAVIKSIRLNTANRSNAPPGYANIPLYSLNCTYRI